jgi:plastocyanin
MFSRSTKLVVLGLLFVALGSIVLVACARSGSATSQATTQDNSGGSSNGSGSASGGPAVHMSDTNFLESSVTIPKGSKLTLIDDTATPHIIQNGSWVDSNAQPRTEAGAPKVDVNFSGSDTHDVGPFTTAGTYKLYCTIHAGMNLTVIVK